MVNSSSFTYKAYSELRKAVLTGDLQPGEKIKIDDIRERLRIGASPVREALSLLTSEGLVERLDQRGFRVAPVSVEDFRELLLTRSWLEERALRESIKWGDKDWEEKIVLAEYRLSKTPRMQGEGGEETGLTWEDAHHSFHRALISACRSRYLLNFCDRLYDRNIRYRNLARPRAYPMRQIEEEHRAIAEATLNRDTELAVQRLLEHYEKTGHYVSEQVALLAS